MCLVTFIYCGWVQGFIITLLPTHLLVKIKAAATILYYCWATTIDAVMQHLRL
jgi:hypothetical protein